MPVMLEAITNIDIAILNALHHNVASPFLDAILPVITSLGNLAFAWFVVAAVLLTSREYRPYGIAMVVAIAFATLIGEFGIKNLIERPRPFLIEPALATELIKLPSSFSFPSGHTGSSFAAATVLCFIPFRNAWVRIVPFAAAALIAFSRLYLCVHYPSDVLGGIVLGIACGVAAGLIVTRAMRSKTRNEEGSR